MNSNDLPDRELTPTELRQLIESNARAIEANSNETAELRRAIAEVANLVRDVGSRADERIDRLAELVRSFVATQISTNHEMDDRITALEATLREANEPE